MTDSAIPAAVLLEHIDWVRAVARSIVSDAHIAADVEQQTWLAALRAPPASDRSPRGWLATVARNAARKLHRSESRRADRECRAVAREPEADPAELVQRAEAHRRVVQAVLALPDLERDVVLMHFYEDVPLREIGRRSGVPYETVRGRLRVALMRLRAGLSRGGTRSGAVRWAPGLIALAVPKHVGLSAGGTVAAMNVGGVAMGAAANITAGLGVAALCVAAFWVGRAGAPPDRSAELAAITERVNELEALPEAAALAGRERSRARFAAMEERMMAIELGRAAERTASTGVAPGTDGVSAGVGDAANRREVTASGVDDAMSAEEAMQIESLRASSESLARSMRGLQLSLLPDAERWAKAVEQVGLSDVQVDVLEQAIADRDAAYADATRHSVENGDGAFVSVTEVDAHALEAADANFQRTFDGTLDVDQRSKWVSGGFDGAFGDSKPTNRRLANKASGDD